VTPQEDAALRALPKVELHCHLEGCVRPGTLVELADRHRVPLPTRDLARIYAYSDMASFLRVFELLSAAVVDRDDVRRITYESLADAAAGGVIYQEMFVNPTVHPACPYPELLAGLREGIALGRERHGVLGRVIMSVYRSHPPEAALRMVEEVAAHPCEEVVGIGMDGDELAGPPLLFRDAYASAAAAGLRRTAHAGERFDAAEIRACLDVLGCERIDHGYGVVTDPDLLARCRAEGIPFTYAWLSTLYNYRGPLADHPFRRMREAGLRMSLGSDDPAIGGSDLAGDYVTVCEAFGWTLDDMRRQVADAVEAAWCSPADKASLRARIASP
jgi:adenosine deaminase